MKKYFAFLSIIILAMSCAKRYEMLTPYNVAEHSRFAGKGTATISGQAFSKTMGGDVKYAAGEKIYLIPKTSYTTEFIDAKSKLSNINIESLNGHIFSVGRVATGNGAGQFIFKDIVPGVYYVYTQIVWHYYQGGYLAQTGGPAWAEAIAQPGDSTYVVVTTR